MIRRTFLKTSSLGMAGSFPFSTGFSKNNNNVKNIDIKPNFTSDGLGLSPKSYARLLMQLTEKQDFIPDTYGMGGNIHDLEEKIANSLGKEKAIYMPTGTLANHIALRLHCPRRKKALVQQQCHIYRDSGDAVQQLSGVNLQPLAPEGITFRLDSIKKSLQDASTEKVRTGIEAISIETPVRRKHLRRFDFEEMKKISQFAREEGIGLHLDGARIYGEATISGIAVKEYGALFDTVYISLYKYFNSIGGAILAGPASLIDGLHNERRMFGGGLRSAWENVIVADHFFDGFQDRFLAAQKKGKLILEKLAATRKFSFKSFEDGTNVYQFFIKNQDPFLFRKKILDAGIDFPNFNKKENCFVIKLNESLNSMEVEEVVEVIGGK